MPLHDLIKDPLTLTLNNIAMARNNLVKLPPADLDHLAIESRLVLRDAIPNHAPLTKCFAIRAVDPVEQSAQHTRPRVDVCFRELLGGGQVEEQVAFYEGSGFAVVEDDFFVCVAVDVGEIKFGVEIRIDGQFAFFARLGGEEVPVCGRDLEITLLVSVFWQGFGRNDLRIGELLVPLLEEDVVLLVQSYEVLGRSEGGHLGSHGRGNGHWGEDCCCAGREAHSGSAAADLDTSKAQERCAESLDVGSERADDHDFLRIRGNEFGN